MKSLANIILITILIFTFTAQSKATNTTQFWRKELNLTKPMFESFSGITYANKDFNKQIGIDKKEPVECTINYLVQEIEAQINKILIYL